MSLFNVLSEAEISGDLTIRTDFSLIPVQVMVGRLDTLLRLQRESGDKTLHRDAIIAHLNELLARQNA